MNLNPPKWALALSVAFPIVVLFEVCWPYLIGSPLVDATASLFTGGVALIVLVIVLKFERWSFLIVAAISAAWLYWSWMATQSGEVPLMELIPDAACLIGAVACCFSKKVPEVKDADHLAFSKKVMLGCIVLAVLEGSSAYVNSFICTNVPKGEFASVEQLTGRWLGSNPMKMSLMQPARLELHSDGTGSLAVGEDRVSSPGGYPVRWLMRGRCLHYAVMETDYWAQGKFCPQISADWQTLMTWPYGPYQITTWQRSH